MSNSNPTELKFIFAHGWGTGNWFWASLSGQLTCARAEFYSRGYFDDDTVFIPPQSSWIGVGHSFGFRRLLGLDLSRCVGLVSLCGFVNFIDQAGTDLRVVKSMIKRFKRAPGKVLEAFRENCGLDVGMPSKLLPANPNLQILEKDLLEMASSGKKDMVVLQSFDPASVLSLAAMQDKIVPNTLTQKEFQDTQFHPIADHSLGFHFASWCAERINSFVESL